MNPEKWVVNLLLPFLFIRFCISIDTLTPTQFIKDGDVLVSSGETFALGFFSPGNSSRRYVGIWYNKISEQTVVWVANRNSGINGTSGVLSLNRDGNLVIYDNTRNFTIWQTTVSASYSARLLDSGNLVLFRRDSGSGGGGVVVWQSFDHPTNTMLPNMKLGLDRRTGLKWFPTSWKSRDDPGTGEYSFRLEPNELPQLILFKGSARIWRLPALLKRQQGSAKAEEMASSITLVNNRDEVYSSYTLINASNPSILFVNELGYLKMAQWLGKWVEFYSVPGEQCVAYGRCGAYGYCDWNNGQDFECTCLPGYEPRSTEEWNQQDATGGCIKKRKELSMCGNGEGFVKVADAKIPDTSKAHVRMSLSMNECKDECLRNCSCLAYTRVEERAGAICVSWYENLMDVRRYVKKFLDGDLDWYVRVDAVELAQRMKSRRLKKKKVAIVVTSVVLTSLLFIIIVCWLVIKKRKRGIDIQDSIDEENIELPIFDMVTLEGATNNFSDTNKIGQGGFGSVFKGHLSTGKDIAVKRLSRDSKQGLKEFKNEVILIAKLQHRNLVRLLGCCILREERMLVYEYMPNGSLDSFIFDITQSKLLTWSRRLDIIIGIARGILYLHQDSRLRVIHRDLKASNVLLDSEMNPKISDFGLARAFGGDQSSAKTKRVVGTYGYMAPEYAIDGLFSTKSGMETLD